MGKRGRAPKQARSRATVDAIVEATGQVFEQRGFRSTTTATVAERAGVSVGSLYQYFPDKRALMTAFFERRLQQDLELMRHVATHAAGATPLEVLRITAEEMVRLYRRDRALYASVAEILPMMEQTREVRESLEHAVALTAAHIRAHPELHGDRDPELLAIVIFHSLRTSLFRIVERDPDRLDDPHLAAILVGGVHGFLGV